MDYKKLSKIADSEKDDNSLADESLEKKLRKLAKKFDVDWEDLDYMWG